MPRFSSEPLSSHTALHMFLLLTLTVPTGNAPTGRRRRSPRNEPLGTALSFRSETSRSNCCNGQRIHAAEAPFQLIYCYHACHDFVVL